MTSEEFKEEVIKLVSKIAPSDGINVMVIAKTKEFTMGMVGGKPVEIACALGRVISEHKEVAIIVEAATDGIKSSDLLSTNKN